MLKRNRQRGFTLIELLIVVAIIGIIAAILIPNLIDALQKAKQKRTMSDVRSTGTAWMSWLTDQVGAASAGAQKKYQSAQNSIGYTTLYSYLRPSDTFFYMQNLPNQDGWKNDLKFGQGTNVLFSNYMGIYAACRDASFSVAVAPGAITIYAFLATDYDQDIIWADGYFIRWPDGFQGGQ
jgi:prepilin-type N-terminal cleavage/methylation domain-containing protein